MIVGGAYNKLWHVEIIANVEHDIDIGVRGCNRVAKSSVSGSKKGE